MASVASVLPADPLACITSPSENPVRYRVQILAPTNHDWSLRRLHEFKQRGLVWTEADASAFRDTLGIVLASTGSDRFFAPKVATMSGVLAPVSDFTEEVSVGTAKVRVLRSRGPADGVAPPPKSGVVKSTGGCPVAVLSYPLPYGGAECVVAHAGLECALPPRFSVHARPDNPPRAHDTIVAAMIAHADARGARREEMHFRVYYGIPWQGLDRPADHPFYGEANRRIHAYLRDEFGDDAGIIRLDDAEQECIHLSRLLGAQARKRRVGTIDAESYDLPLNGRYAYTTHENPELAGLTRNLVTLVVP